MRIAIKFAYDGTKFSGSQRQGQDNLATVEDKIIECLQTHHAIIDPQESKLQLASRTDAGVSALGNIVAFNSDYSETDLMNILNSKLLQCWFYGYMIVPDDFNPRHAERRWYRYYLYNGDSFALIPQNESKSDIEFNIERKYDPALIRSISKSFEGSHDFRNFSNPSLEDTSRSIDNITISTIDPWIMIDFKAKSFLWHQIRRMVQAWIKFADGKIDQKEILRALEKPENKIDIGLASAKPLFLMDVKYKEIEFIIDRQIINKMLNRLLKAQQDAALRTKFFDNFQERII
jgi:tRNA pseudouridine38-40 synthase